MFSVRDQYTLEELKRLIYIPTPSQFKENDLNKLPIHYFNSKYYLPKENEFKEGITVGWIFHPILEKRAIKIPYSILSQHLFTGGMSGSGKSASLHEMVDDLIPEVGKIKPGYLFFDPKRLSAVRIINHILAMWKKGLNVDWSRIHYIDLKLGNYVPSFNLLYKSSYRNSTEIINKTLELFKDVYDSGDNTALLDKMIRNLVGALVLGKQDATILDAVRMVEDTRFRSKVASGIKGSINKEFVDFWKKEYKDSDFNSTINRLSMFQPATMKRMYGQKGFDLDFEKWQREGHIVIINGLDMTDRATTLTVGQIVNNHLEQLLNSKSNKGFMVIIDEGARAQVNGYFRTLAEGREVGAWLSFCTQDISLMKTKFATGLLKNISSYKVGRHDPESAKKMSQSLGGAVDPITIQNLPNNTMLLKTMNKDNDNNLVTMQVTSNPPYWYLENGDIAEYGNEEETEQAIKWSEEKALELQKRDWKHRDEIDKELFEENKNIFNDEIFDIIESDVNNQSIAKVF